MTTAPPLGLAVDLSVGGTAQVALVGPEGFEPGSVIVFADSSAATLTDVFMAVERTLGHSLRGTAVVLAVPGVPGRTVIPVLRSRWTLSRDGLNQFFGRPVTIVNDGAALAWAAAGEPEAGIPIGGSDPATALPPLSRRALIQFEAGLGAAVVDKDAGGALRVLETELGHIGFAPADGFDDHIVGELRAARKPVSWEQVLRIAPGSHPSVAFAALPVAEQQALFTRWAADFVMTVALATCAWDGIYLSGSGWDALSDPAAGQAFLRRLRGHRTFSRQFEALRCWRVEQHSAVLRGCAQLLRQMGGSEPAALASAEIRSRS
jgi:glucokinase